MRKIINDPDNIVEEMMEGFIAAYHHMYYKHPEVNSVISRCRRKNKVSLIIGGGSGHEPMFSGFVGAGLADAACCGNIFASPDPKNIYETGKSIDEGKGILFVYGCYAGDNLNFDMGEEFLNAKGIKTAHVRVQDDVASAPKERRGDRRGIAGDVFVIKIAGAACDAGLELEEVTRITEKARDNTRTIGVATAPAQLPGADKPIFELGEDEIEYGMGLHGEKGVERTKWEPADVLVEKMYRQIMEDSDLKRGDKVCVLVNGLGSTTILELSIVFRKLNELLKEDGIGIYDTDLNNYCTSQEMGGFSITLMKLDDELRKYYDMQNPDMELFILPSYTSLETASKSTDQSEIHLGAQNMCWEDEGQFTGEISPVMLEELDLHLVMVGHSERRHVFGESNIEENKKMLAAMKHGFTGLLCIGETKEEKGYGIADEVLRTQIKVGLHGIAAEDLDKVWIAYEPVWAIGVNGIPAPVEYAQEKHHVIRETLRELYGEAADVVPALYGGSVNLENATRLFVQPDIDGLYVGRVAWDAKRFAGLIADCLATGEK